MGKTRAGQGEQGQHCLFTDRESMNDVIHPRSCWASRSSLGWTTRPFSLWCLKPRSSCSGDSSKIGNAEMVMLLHVSGHLCVKRNSCFFKQCQFIEMNSIPVQLHLHWDSPCCWQEWRRGEQAHHTHLAYKPSYAHLSPFFIKWDREKMKSQNQT